MTGITALLDTTILVDLSRNRPAAVEWFQSQAQTSFAVPVIVYMELVDGARDAADQRFIIGILKPYPVIHLNEADSQWAQVQHTRFRLSHSVGIGDALIAAAAFRLQVPLYTLNVKHFSPLPGITATRPY